MYVRTKHPTATRWTEIVAAFISVGINAYALISLGGRCSELSKIQLKETFLAIKEDVMR